MIIETNKDIESYKESVVLGLNVKQLITALISIGAGITVVLFLYPYIGVTGAGYAAVIVVAPIVLNGFYTKNGMSLFVIWKKRLHFIFHNKPLRYISTENVSNVRKSKETKNNSNEFTYRKRGIIKNR